MSTNEMRERLRLAMKYPHDCEEALKLEGKVLAFTESEVALAMAPRENEPFLRLFLYHPPFLQNRS